jgi:hypothetical protein
MLIHSRFLSWFTLIVVPSDTRPFIWYWKADSILAKLSLAIAEPPNFVQVTQQSRGGILNQEIGL